MTFVILKYDILRKPPCSAIRRNIQNRGSFHKTIWVQRFMNSGFYNGAQPEFMQIEIFIFIETVVQILKRYFFEINWPGNPSEVFCCGMLGLVWSGTVEVYTMLDFVEGVLKACAIVEHFEWSGVEISAKKRNMRDNCRFRNRRF